MFSAKEVEEWKNYEIEGLKENIKRLEKENERLSAESRKELRCNECKRPLMRETVSMPDRIVCWDCYCQETWQRR